MTYILNKVLEDPILFLVIPFGIGLIANIVYALLRFAVASSGRRFRSFLMWRAIRRYRRIHYSYKKSMLVYDYIRTWCVLLIVSGMFMSVNIVYYFGKISVKLKIEPSDASFIDAKYIVIALTSASYFMLIMYLIDLGMLENYLSKVARKSSPADADDEFMKFLQRKYPTELQGETKAEAIS